MNPGIEIDSYYHQRINRLIGPIFESSSWAEGESGEIFTTKTHLPDEPDDPRLRAVSDGFYIPFRNFIKLTGLAATQNLPENEKVSQAEILEAQLRETLACRVAAILELQPDSEFLSQDDIDALSDEAKAILPFREKVLGPYNSLFQVDHYRHSNGQMMVSYHERYRLFATENALDLATFFPNPPILFPQLEAMRQRGKLLESSDRSDFHVGGLWRGMLLEPLIHNQVDDRYRETWVRIGSGEGDQFFGTPSKNYGFWGLMRMPGTFDDLGNPNPETLHQAITFLVDEQVRFPCTFWKNSS